MSLLKDAVIKADLETLKMIFYQGERRQLFDVDSHTGNTLLHEIVDSFEPGSSYPVSEDRRMGVVRFLAEEAKLDIKIKNSKGETALDIADRKHGKNNVLSKYFGLHAPSLIAPPSKFTLAEKTTHASHIFDYIKTGNLPALQNEISLLSDEFDIGSFTDEEGNTPLMAAVKAKKRQIIVALLEDERIKNTPNATNKNGETVFDLVEDIETENLLRNL